MAHDNALPCANEALTPLSASQRVFGWHDHAWSVRRWGLPLAKWAPQFGSALPTLAATLVLAWLSQPRSTSRTAGGASALAQSHG
jgi:hypothetical protein